jgi:tRNA threonylcarbamoyladenosine biosynthesis protein TsaE
MSVPPAGTHVTTSEQATEALAARFAASLGPGAVVLLTGTLGAGKTAFVRGLAAGLGCDPADVSSPTFTLVHEYRGGRLTLYHADLYRLSGVAGEDLGLMEHRVAEGVLAVEWPDRLRVPIPGTQVRIDVTGEGDRRIAITPSGSSALPS